MDRRLKLGLGGIGVGVAVMALFASEMRLGTLLERPAAGVLSWPLRGGFWVN